MEKNLALRKAPLQVFLAIKMAQKYGMTKSGLVTFLINQADDKGTIFK